MSSIPNIYAPAAAEQARAEGEEALLVPQTTTVNGYSLSGNVVVSASDITTGTLPHAQLPALVSGDIPNNAASTSGSAANLSGTPTLPNGVSGATQGAFDNSGKLATTAYADNLVKGVSVVGFREDFLGINGTSAGSATGTTITGMPSDTFWLVSNVVGGTWTLANVASTFANPGIISLQPAATSGEGCVIYKSGIGANSTLGILGSNEGWEINIVFALNQTANICVRAGVCEAAGATVDAPTDGMWVEYDTANASSNADYTWRTRKASSDNYVRNLSFTQIFIMCFFQSDNYSTVNSKAYDTNLHHVRIRSTSIGTILFSIDGGTETAITTDVPTVRMIPFFQVIARSTGNTINASIDFYSYMAATGRT